MRGTFRFNTSKFLVLITCVALLGGGSGCSLSSFGFLEPLIRMGYNMFATLFNTTFFGNGTSTGFTF